MPPVEKADPGPFRGLVSLATGVANNRCCQPIERRLRASILGRGYDGRMPFLRPRWVHSTGSVSVCLYDLVESVRHPRLLLDLGVFESVEAIKRRLAVFRRSRSGNLDAYIAHLEALLTKIARLLATRPRSRRMLWPDADEWLRGRGTGAQVP